MLGLMQDFPLLIPRLLNYVERFHGRTEIVSRRVEGDIHRYTYLDMAFRTRQLANALTRLDINPGKIVGTIAWNGYRHLELYYALPGIQAVYHTINPRLSSAQLEYIINHAEDEYIFIEKMFLPLIEKISGNLKSVKGYIVLCEEEDMPNTSLFNTYCYESLIAAENDQYDWKDFDEQSAAGICYTSGTTGNQKGVVYSHRALVLQAMNTAIGIELNSRDVILPVVPMFHVNAWVFPYLVAVLGNKFVLPGKDYDGASIYELLENEKVTYTAGVPTIWQMLLDYLEQSKKKLSHLKRIGIGGAAASRSMLDTFQNVHGIEPLHAWGMTETTAMGVAPCMTNQVVERGNEAIMQAKMTQGRAALGTEIKIIDDDGKELPMDGESAGRLCVRGWNVASSYYKQDKNDSFLEDNWFETGDIATINPDGFMKLTDRIKDMIKSGGEWISSIDLENAIIGHPDVSSAAVIGVYHPKWDERPLLIVVLKPDCELDKQSILKYMENKVTKWNLPDDIVSVKSLPIGATGKIQKNELREQLKDYSLPNI